MLTREQECFIKKKAYVPEHIYPYVVSVSGAEPYFYEPFIVYEKKESLIIVGYPIDCDFREEIFCETLNQLKNKKKKKRILGILPKPLKGLKPKSSDHYYILQLENLVIDQKTKNMIKRAKKELVIETKNELTFDHIDLIERFISWKRFDEETSLIFRNLSTYVNNKNHVKVITARNAKGNLIAFDVVDTCGLDYAFYMFNVRSQSEYVPGTSDLLFEQIIRIAAEEGKKFVNLGLGINDGIRFFKKKWGGRPYLEYHLYEWWSQETLFYILMNRFLGE
ncbi:MAG: hypothetical protein N2513_03790 [Deltaproteobacteria bacterium]|nr:hypothetical protein [Deltaproteobacteria bacterium]